MPQKICVAIFLAAVLNFFGLTASSQIVFDKIIGDTLNDEGEKIVADIQGYLIVLAQTLYTENLVLRFDTNGNMIDSFAFPISTYGNFVDIVAQQNGNFYVITKIADSSNLLEFSPDFGSITGKKNLGVNDQYFSLDYYHLVLDSFGNVYAYGTKSGFPPPYFTQVSSGLLVKLDSNLNVIYSKSLGAGAGACCSWSEILKLQPNGKCLLDVAAGGGGPPSHTLYSFDGSGNTLSTLEFFGYGIKALDIIDAEKFLILADNFSSCTLSTVDTAGTYLSSVYDLFLYQGFSMLFANMHNLGGDLYLLIGNTPVDWGEELIAWQLVNSGGDSLDAADYVFPSYHRYQADYLSPSNMLYLIGTTFETSNDDENIDLIKIAVPNYVGIEPADNINSMIPALFPNPAKDMVTVNLNSFPLYSKFTLQVFTLDGKLFRDFTFSSVDRKEISVSDFPGGIYVTKLLGDNRPLSINKLVIQP